MKSNIPHSPSLTSLLIEVKHAKHSRSASRFGRNGETNGGAYMKDALRAYNKSERKAAKSFCRQAAFNARQVVA